MMMTVRQVATLLDCPTRFVSCLSARGMLPKPDKEGLFPLAGVRAAMARIPWLGLLGTPLSERELAARVDERLRLPPGEGVRVAGRSYCRLWRVLDHAWRDA